MEYFHYSDALANGFLLDAGEAASGAGVGFSDAPEGWDTRQEEIDAYGESEEV